MFFRFIFTTVLLLTVTPAVLAYTPKPLPAHLQTCVDVAIAELAASDGSADDIRRLFDRHVSIDGLGYAVWLRAWKFASPQWQEIAILLYQDLLITKSNKAIGKADVVSVASRLADNPERGGDGTKGYWHVAFTATLSTGKTIAAAALVTDGCKVIELSQGGWLGSFITATDVDIALHEAKRK